MLVKSSFSMDSNGCNVNYLDVDVRLPPRKRLLAGLRKQSCSQSISQCSPENNSSPNSSPSIDQNPLSEFDARLNNLLKSYKNGVNMSPEEIALAAKSVAEAAAKAAKAARAVAEEKSNIAAKAVEIAKSVLNLIAYEETQERSRRHHKKNKLKKQVPVDLLYNKYQPVEKCGKDEEFAMRLHRAMNSSPRIGKHSPGSESRTRKHKKLRIYSPNDKSGVSNGSIMRDRDVEFPNGDLEGGIDYEGSNEKMSRSSENDEVEMDSGEVESIYPKEKSFKGFGVLCSNGRTRKRGRTKQKKLSLSICSSKDQASPKEESNLTDSLLTRGRTDNSTARRLSLISVEPSSDDVTLMGVAPTWKRQDFKECQCVKQDKLVES